MIASLHETLCMLLVTFYVMTQHGHDMAHFGMSVLCETVQQLSCEDLCNKKGGIPCDLIEEFPLLLSMHWILTAGPRGTSIPVCIAGVIQSLLMQPLQLLSLNESRKSAKELSYGCKER